MNQPVNIYGNRKLQAAAALALAAVTCLVVARAIAAGSVGMTIFLTLVFALPLAYYVARLLRRRPAVVIGPEGIGGTRVGRTISWESISGIHATRQRGAYGVYHEVVVQVRSEGARQLETIEFSIDLLAMRWSEIVTLLQERFGRRIETRRQTLLTVLRAWA
jgi:hypothetical protein